MRKFTLLPAIAFLFAAASAAENTPALADAIDVTVRRLMQSHDIPGMAVAITVDGNRLIRYFGVASRESGEVVAGETLFEIGSISKTFTATLAASAQAEGKLSLAAGAASAMPSLKGSAFGEVGLLHLATHTAGGLPLQVPDHIADTSQLMQYLKDWQPAHSAGTQRTYSNVGIGVLGMIAAASMGVPFEEAMERKLFPALGMNNTYLRVPAARMKDYAQGYTRKDAPVRMSPGVLWAEAYGVKSSATDMIGFVEANMRLAKLDGKLQRAIDDTHKGYFQSAELTQGMVWEMYPYPAPLSHLLAGNSDRVIYQAVPASRLDKPLPSDVLINKTGSTNGFAAYVAFIPVRKTGIVMLANKNFPIEARVKAAYEILTRLGEARQR